MVFIIPSRDILYIDMKNIVKVIHEYFKNKYDDFVEAKIDYPWMKHFIGFYFKEHIYMGLRISDWQYPDNHRCWTYNKCKNNDGIYNEDNDIIIKYLDKSILRPKGIHIHIYHSHKRYFSSSDIQKIKDIF